METVKLSSTNQEEIVKRTLSILKSGGLVVFPTDTVYGLLCDTTNSTAVDKLLKFKDRPVGKAISVFVSDENMAKRYIITNPNSTNIFKNLLPGPFTIVCNSLHNTDKRLEAENGTLGIRFPDFPLITELVKQYGKPLTATSANLSGTPAHHSIESFINSCRGRACSTRNDSGIARNAPTVSKYNLISLIIDAGNLPKNKPSTVIDTTSGSLKTLRLGDLLPNTPNSLLSKSENETRQLARFILSKALKKSLGKPIVFLLQGELGTGKTIFTKGLGKILGVKEEIVSPTYTLCYEYKIDTAMSSRAKSRDPFPNDFSTKNPDLSTDQPIENSSGFDIKGQDLNIDYVDQEQKIGCEWEVRNGSGSENEKCVNNSAYPTSHPRHTSHISPPLLVHYDLYRVESPADLKEIKFLESIVPGNIYAIEWPERIDEETLSKLKEIAQIIYITIKHVDKMTREIRWS